MSSTPSNITSQYGESVCLHRRRLVLVLKVLQGPKDSEPRLWPARPRHSARRPRCSHCPKLVCVLMRIYKVGLNRSFQSTHCWCHTLPLLLRRSRTTDLKFRGTPRSHSRSCSNCLYQVFVFPHLMTTTSHSRPQHPPTKVGCGIHSRALGHQADLRRPRICEPCPWNQAPGHYIS